MLGDPTAKGRMIKFIRPLIIDSKNHVKIHGKSKMKDNNIFHRMRSWISDLPIKDPVDRVMASLLQVILLGLIAIVIVAMIINLALPTNEFPDQVIVIRSLFTILIIGIPFLLLRRGYFQYAVFIILAMLLFLITFATFSTNLRSIAENLTFFTLAIILAGLLVGRKTLIVTFTISAVVVLDGALRESNPAFKIDSLSIAGNFILLNGLMSLFLDRFGVNLRNSLKKSLQSEGELKKEISTRKQVEANLEKFASRLAILHEIDRSLLTAYSLHDIAKSALSRIRKLIPCERASVTIFNFKTREARFLTTDFDEMEKIPDTPISLEAYGLRVIEQLQQNKPWLTNGILEDAQTTELNKQLANEYGIQTWLALPLFHQGELIGALNLGRVAGNPFTPEDTEIAHDVANQLAIALQQTNLYNTLQEELVERKKLIAELEASNAEMERFTYTVSHDLRNPLVTIKGFLGMLERDIQENHKDRIRSDFQRIASATDKMDELLSDLLKLSRTGRIINPPEEVDLVKLAREAIESLDARIHSKEVTIKVSPSLPTVYGDRIRLREVFENLIDNAIKYVENQKKPLIEIGVRSQANEQIIFIKDNGIGIDKRYHDRIFSLFEKLDPAIEGTGVGLALVKRIIETHGGKIWVESEGTGKGSTFCFTIPDGKPQ